MNQQQRKRIRELGRYAVTVARKEGLPAMAKRTAGFVKRRFFRQESPLPAGQKSPGGPAGSLCGQDPGRLRPARHQHPDPLYNTPPAYLRAFLDSFVNQTAPNGQLCLADASDSAHGEVGQIVREYQAKNQQIVYKKIENQGIAANTNAAAALADGEYLALADHDDVLAPHAMYEMGRAILDLRAAGKPDGFLYSDEALFEKDIRRPLVNTRSSVYAPDYLLCCNYICHLAVFRRALFEQVGGERPECDGSQDHDLSSG